MNYDAFRPRQASFPHRQVAPQSPVDPSPADPPPSFAQIQADPAIGRLRAARRPVVAVLATVLGLHLLNSLLATVVPDLLAVRLFGAVNAGMVLALLLTALGLAATHWYARRARTYDALAAQVRASFEREGRR